MKSKGAIRVKEWRKNNPERVKTYKKEYNRTHKGEQKERFEKWRDKNVFGGNKFKALERDNWECQECGLSQEQSIILFNRKLFVHHIDGHGRNSKDKNHNLDNLITLCPRCHGKIHGEESRNKCWGNLLQQDDSEWKFPMLRKLISSKICNNINLKDAKTEVSKELGVAFRTIDGYYYARKSSENKKKR